MARKQLDPVRQQKQDERIDDVERHFRDASLSLLKAYERSHRVVYSVERDRILALRKRLHEVRGACSRSMERKIGRGLD